jgi:hypothetical protein
MLPIIISPAIQDVPSSKLSPTEVASPSTPTANSLEMPIFFDARVVAHQDDGWEDMPGRILLRWTSVAVEERRNRSR